MEAAFFYPYDAIAKKWESYLGWKGVAKGYAKRFLSQSALVAGSDEARDDPIWGVSHVFYKGIESKSGVLGLYFIDSDIGPLLDIIMSKQPLLNRESLLPNPTRSVPFASFTSVAAVTFSTAKELQTFRSKQVPTGDALLLTLNRKAYQMFQDTKCGTVMAIDVESYERNHAYILEIGWSSITFAKADDEDQTAETRSCEHILISECRDLRNGSYTPNHRFNFNFGTSEEYSLDRTLSMLSDIIDTYRKTGPLFLVFHSAAAEIAYFSKLGIDTTKWVVGLPDPAFWNDPIASPPGETEVRLREGAVYVMDTQRLFNASGLPEAQRQVGLENALKALDIPSRYLHNAGNDACYTLAMYEALVGAGRLKEELQAEDSLRVERRRDRKSVV